MGHTEVFSLTAAIELIMDTIDSLQFIPGLQLSRHLYFEEVAPLMVAHFPKLAYAAGLLGPGSEVLGYDTPQSRDHDWGPRLMLFLSANDLEQVGQAIDAVLRLHLPCQLHGYPIDLAWNFHPDGPPSAGEGARHRVTLHTVSDFTGAVLGIDATHDLSPVDWLVTPQQLLLSLVQGAVFHDGPGELTAVRIRLAYYPDPVWHYMLAAQWQRISQEEAFVGRTGQVGDDLGSRTVAARLVRDVVNLCFLYERQYAPYIKWLGTTFSRLPCATAIEPLLLQTLAAVDWRARERPLLAALALVATLHNELALTKPLPVEATPFHERPFSVIHGERFAKALRERITDPGVFHLPSHLGGVDQYIDSTDLLSNPVRMQEFRALYASDPT